MKSRVLAFVVSVVSWVATAGMGAGVADISDIQSLSLLNSFVDAKTWVVFDIDNTLIAPKHNVGSDAWFYEVWTFLRRDPNDADHYAKAIKQWVDAQAQIEIQAVESVTVDVVARLQARGIPVMALTARDEKLADLTLAQLAALGIDLAKQAPHLDPLNFATAAFPQLIVPAAYRSGVVFGGSNNKGHLLQAFLETLPSQPQRIVYVDDKKEHVDHVIASCRVMGIECMGLRYGALDQKIARFQKRASEQLSSSFQKLDLEQFVKMLGALDDVPLQASF